MKFTLLLLPIAAIAILAFMFISHNNLKDKKAAAVPQQESATAVLTKGNSDQELEMDAAITDQDLDQITTDTNQFSESLNDAPQDNESNITE